MGGYSPLMILAVAWSAVTLVLVGLIIYRAVVGIHEENQIFLDRAEAALEKEQVETLKRIHAVDGFLKGTAILSGVLLLILAVLWVYQGLNSQTTGY